MTAERSDEDESASVSRRGVLCAKCEHLNPSGSNVCERCAAHLHVSCSNCGHRNERVRSRCTHCRQRLHRPLGTRLARRLLGRNRKVSPLQILLLVAGILLAFAVVKFLAELRLPKPL